MDRPWAWGVYDEEGLRFAVLMTQHELRDLAVRLAVARDRAGMPPGASERIRMQFHDAYRDLTGVLAGVRAEELDRAPADGEWPVRVALQHMLGAVYGFSAVVQLAVEAIARGERQEEPRDEEFARARARPERIAEGDMREVGESLASAHRRALEAMTSVGDGALERPALFWDGAMPLRFRLHRFEAHFRQHTVQIEKTLVAIGHPPTEAERLVRLVHRALGDVEAIARTASGHEEIARAAALIEERANSLA